MVLIPLRVDKSQISALLVIFFLLEQHLLSRVKEELLIPPKTLMFLCLSCLAWNEQARTCLSLCINCQCSWPVRNSRPEKGRQPPGSITTRDSLGLHLAVLLLCRGCINPFRRAVSKVIMVAWSTKSAIKAEKWTNSVCGGRNNYNVPLKLDREGYIKGRLESNSPCFPIAALVHLGSLTVILYHKVT